ncbi:hypothetical protein D9M71_290260 [compost metagenome]
MVAEDLTVGKTSAYHLFHERAPYQEGAVALGQHQRAAFVDLEVAVVTHEPLHFDGAEQYAGEAAVGILQAPGNRNDQVAGGTAAHHRTDTYTRVGMAAVIGEVVPVGVIGVGRDCRLISDDPAAVRAVNEKPVQLRHDAFLLGQQGVQAGPVDVIETIAFQPLGQGCGNGVDLADSVLGVLRRGSGQVADHVLGIVIGKAVVAPDAPTFHQYKCQHHHQHERQYQAEQRHRAALATYGVKPIVVLFPGCAHWNPWPYRVRRLHYSSASHGRNRRQKRLNLCPAFPLNRTRH